MITINILLGYYIGFQASEYFRRLKDDKTKSIKIVAVSKTFSLDHIMPLIKYGHNHFGENKVQEADAKWAQIKKNREFLGMVNNRIFSSIIYNIFASI